MRRARAEQLFGRLLIPALVFGVDSTPRMGECVGGWDGAISGWGYGPAPFPHLLSHSARLLRSIGFCPSCPSTSFAICYGVDYWGKGVLHQVYWASGTREGG